MQDDMHRTSDPNNISDGDKLTGCPAYFLLFSATLPILQHLSLPNFVCGKLCSLTIMFEVSKFYGH